ncbi:MAG: tetratricopeptide repeat protein [Myxococcales bacterium]
MDAGFPHGPIHGPTERLREDIEWALRFASDPQDILPMLHRLARASAEGSDHSLFAHRNLAEVLAERSPWRAALHARRVVQARPDDDRAWAALGLSQIMLGHYRYAARAYERALAVAPSNPWYAHNFGHLLDVALERPSEALPWLESAYEQVSWSGEVCSSYAHALIKVGQAERARQVLAEAMHDGGSREHEALLRWLDTGSNATPPPRAASRATRGRAAEATRPPAVTSHALGAFDATLARGLAKLPFDPRQCARAIELTRDAYRLFARPTDSLAAAIAYAIVYVDHVPLTPSEVAASFRVSVSSLRGRFTELRARLDLTPGDTRYASR